MLSVVDLGLEVQRFSRLGLWPVFQSGSRRRWRYALLRRDDHILFLRRAGSGCDDGELSLPAGHVDEGENALCAVVREVGEELLLTVEPEDYTLALTGQSGAGETRR